MNEDVKFTYSGTDYEYMLAVDNSGAKRWLVEQRYLPPPSLIKHHISMVIVAAPSVRDLDDDIYSTKDIATVLAQLRTLTDGHTITLLGYDDETYYVTFDPNATRVNTVTNESGRITQYEIEVACWDLYQ